MIYDVDGNGYIDYCMSWGPLLHGHAHPEILSAIQKQMVKGTTFGTTSSIEEKLARKTIELMPAIQKIRFVSSGTEATMSAARLARGFTGRNYIIKFTGHYHGHADPFLVQAGSGVFNLTPTSTSKGIPADFVKYTLCLPFNSIEATKKIFNDPELSKDIAAVILEPVAGNMGVVPATPEFMQMLREETEKAGALLIFDEVMTCFRVCKGGASELYGIDPDLICLGKIIGGGLPAAAFGGKREIMDMLAPLGPVYQAGTLSGNPLAMAAGLKALELLDAPGAYAELQKKTDRLVHPIQDYIAKNEINACIQSVGSMLTLFFGRRQVRSREEAESLDFELFGKFFRAMLKKGIYLPPLQQEAWFISLAHTDEHLDQTAAAIIDFLKTAPH